MEFSLEDQFRGFIRTPQIFSENTFFQYPLFTTSIIQGESIAEDLTEPQTRVLGKRMEHFFHYFITHFTSLEVVAHNEQIIKGKETLGELDYLLKDPVSGLVSHVELIYKFYLYNPDDGTSEKDHLIGPNKRDSLNRKLDRLQKRQFPLLFEEATAKLLQKLRIDPRDVVQEMCFKALVFMPRLMRKVNLYEINHASVAGYWISSKDFTSHEYGDNLFFSPKKKYWPLDPVQNHTWFTFSEVLEQVEHFMEEHLSILMWMKTPEGEIERFFIVWW